VPPGNHRSSDLRRTCSVRRKGRDPRTPARTARSAIGAGGLCTMRASGLWSNKRFTPPADLFPSIGPRSNSLARPLPVKSQQIRESSMRRDEPRNERRAITAGSNHWSFLGKYGNESSAHREDAEVAEEIVFSINLVRSRRLWDEMRSSRALGFSATC
jgi:hypothetical protein